MQVAIRPAAAQRSAQPTRNARGCSVRAIASPPRIGPISSVEAPTPPATRQAGPADVPAPSYEEIDRKAMNVLVMSLFRRKMVDALGVDSQQQGYAGIVDLTRKLNNKYRNPVDTQEATRAILKALFPSWLLPAFRMLFAKPMPDFSCRLNAVATALTCQWLMGPCKVNDVEFDDGTVGKGQGVFVERCRYLEETGCASVCINSCKVPTQTFFARDMGIPLTMTPNYDDFSCQFSFGKAPPSVKLDGAFTTACFNQCPSKKARGAVATACGGIDPPAKQN
ncbi:hypothetical protein HYH03_004182 [Edaphochlamys debaryana]|uniref:Beta-carotene isomerase D27-like C-terminal domain-containing protein n=1 Tax=Edaphochlamys debaryana TaxID=47281 RepID=A0A835YAW5_9CHLO|nr:hypothetical protein HYH03_004182 [Edaphochlamys debaryana]|eukprot:KAG2497918.1 hypothetical protein HYH03_004182 [Edaphochlamys debaryana]